MKQLRRLGTEAPADPYRRLRRGLFRSVTLPEEAYRRLERERPELIVSEGDGALVAEPYRGAYRVHYSYPNRDAFLRRFPSMLDSVLPSLRQDEAPLGITLRLFDQPSRPYMEPALRALAFEVSRDWLRMELRGVPSQPAPHDEIAPGFALRPATPDDADVIAQLDEISFPINLITPAAAHELLHEAPMLRILDEANSHRAAGFLHLETRGDAGHVSTIAVHPDYRRRGLGEAIMRWAIAYFASERRSRVALTVTTDNAPAIALYRKLGFVHGESGIDYRRPIDADEVRLVLERQRATHIRVRRRN